MITLDAAGNNTPIVGVPDIVINASPGMRPPVTTVDEKIRAAVEAALKKNPKATVDELYELAKGISRSVTRMNKRQFHARYPLQIKRRAKKGAAKVAGAKAKAAPRKKAKTARKKAAAKKPAAKKTAAGAGKAAAKKAVVRKTKAAAKRVRTAARKARAAAARKAAPASAATPAPQLDREAIRKTFLRFASDLTGAEARKDLVKVLAGVDRYVDEVVKAVEAK